MKHLLLLEDNVQINTYLSELISKDYALLGNFINLSSAKDYCANTQVDLAIIDICLPDGSGLELVEYLTKSQPNAKKLIFTILDDSEVFLSSIKYGVDGYILKDAEESEILTAIAQTLKGYAYISAKMARYLLDKERISQSKKNNINRFNLTPREKDVLRLICIGLSYSDIASQLDLRLSTVSSYMKTLYSKMSVNSKSEAVYKVFKNDAILIK